MVWWGILGGSQRYIILRQAKSLGELKGSVKAPKCDSCEHQKGLIYPDISGEAHVAPQVFAELPWSEESRDTQVTSPTRSILCLRFQRLAFESKDGRRKYTCGLRFSHVLREDLLNMGQSRLQLI